MDSGPSFTINCTYVIEIIVNSSNFIIRTYENGHKEVFNGDTNALSEDGNYKGIIAKECEVFHIVF